MKIYFASRYKHKDYLVSLSRDLKDMGHEVVSSWIKIDSLKPYDKNLDYSKKVAKKVEEDIDKCDIFVLISDEGGTDMFVELGIAIAKRKEIYVIGEHGKRSLMSLHPNIKHIDSIYDFLNLL